MLRVIGIARALLLRPTVLTRYALLASRIYQGHNVFMITNGTLFRICRKLKTFGNVTIIKLD